MLYSKLKLGSSKSWKKFQLFDRFSRTEPLKKQDVCASQVSGNRIQMKGNTSLSLKITPLLPLLLSTQKKHMNRQCHVYKRRRGKNHVEWLSKVEICLLEAFSAQRECIFLKSLSLLAADKSTINFSNQVIWKSNEINSLTEKILIKNSKSWFLLFLSLQGYLKSGGRKSWWKIWGICDICTQCLNCYQKKGKIVREGT